MNVLYISAEIRCFENWQIANIIFLVVWALPFPIALSTGYYLLKMKFITISNCMVCVMLPISSIIFIYRSRNRIRKRNEDEEEKEARSQLFQMFEVSYRPKFFWWESYRLLERLLVAGIVTFVITLVKRTMILSVIFALFLLFRYVLNLYKRSLKLVKMLDLVSNIFLCVLVAINMFRAVIFTHNLPFQFPVDEVSNMAYYIEYLLSPLWILIILFLIKQFFGNR